MCPLISNIFCSLVFCLSQLTSDEDLDYQNNDNNVYEQIHENNGYFHEFDPEFDDFEEEVTTESEYSITDDERKRQNHINEFIATEKAYVRDMEVVIDVSPDHKSPKLRFRSKLLLQTIGIPKTSFS